jgi:hypothetical protein
MKNEPPLTNREKVNGDLVWTGRPRHVYSSVCRSVSALTREEYVERFKIGITNHPWRRFTAYADAYDEMILLYRSGSIQNVSDMETMLVEHNRGWSKNRTGGGGGNIGRVGPYYLYVVLCRRRQETSAIDSIFTALLISLSVPAASSNESREWL